MAFHPIDTEDAIRLVVDRSIPWRGVAFKVRDPSHAKAAKEGLDKILISEGYMPSMNGGQMVYASGRFTPEEVERMRAYAKSCPSAYDFISVKGTKADFDGPYWFKNIPWG